MAHSEMVIPVNFDPRSTTSDGCHATVGDVTSIFETFTLELNPHDDDDILDQEWLSFVEDYPECEKFLERDCSAEDYSVLRRTDSGDNDGTADGGCKRYEIDVDVRDFRPEEISVKVVGRDVTVKSKMVESGGLNSGEFGRMRSSQAFFLPPDVDTVTTRLTPNGFLNISATSTVAESSKEKLLSSLDDNDDSGFENESSSIERDGSKDSVVER